MATVYICDKCQEQFSIEIYKWGFGSTNTLNDIDPELMYDLCYKCKEEVEDTIRVMVDGKY